jgi:isopenicillin-N N-acyltransferase like protein
MPARIKKILIYYSLAIVALSAAGYIALRSWVIMDPPEIDDTSALQKEVEKVSDSLLVIDSNWLHTNDKGLWEMYIQGKPFERGVIAGKLSSELINFQEKAFIDRINQLVPSIGYQRILRLLIAVFNHGIDKNIPKEYLEEIYGISHASSDEYDYVGPKYDRQLHYHGAHDIGHMLQNYNLVGCTSFAVWGNKSADKSLLVGRNFDFYVGDDFAEKKIIEFCKPDSGYGFMMVTWGGMCGCVSGMNEKGLTITINAAKSVIPLSVADPVSLISREILQYASTIDEAYAIAQKRNCFVSESYLIASAIDNKAVVIEKSPYDIDIYSTGTNQIICTNHFQSKKFKDQPLNVEHIKRSASMARYKRVAELLDFYDSVSVYNAACILRDQHGLGNTDIGMGNEKVINQLIAHHSIIFKPAQGLVWVSTAPYQIGEYIAYDLHAILANPKIIKQQHEIYKKELTLPSDPFIKSSAWQNYQEFQKQVKQINGSSAKENDGISDQYIEGFIVLNPNFFYTYEVCGDYFTKIKGYSKAIKYYQEALKKEIPTFGERERVEEKLQKCSTEK